MQSKYTEVLVNLLNNPEAKASIELAMSDYPLYTNPDSITLGGVKLVPTREELNNKILNYYKYREIGFETFGRFLDELKTSLHEIMPKYNQLFYSLDQEFNIIYNVDYEKTISRKLEGENTNNQDSTSNTTSDTSDTSTVNTTSDAYNKNVKTLTPQGELSISNDNIDNVTYADEVTWDKNNSTSSSSSNASSHTNGAGTSNITGTASNNENEDITERTKGNYGTVSAQDLILKYRETIINIEQEIINDKRISELFMMVY